MSVKDPTASNGPPSDSKEGSSTAVASESVPGMRTMTILVADSSITKTPLALPAARESMSRLLDSISKSSLEHGKLPEFADRSLASLSADYKTESGSGSYPEPAELTEQQWDTILTNNRALHGYVFNFDRNILIKAKKRGRTPNIASR